MPPPPAAYSGLHHPPIPPNHALTNPSHFVPPPRNATIAGLIPLHLRERDNGKSTSPHLARRQTRPQTGRQGQCLRPRPPLRRRRFRRYPPVQRTRLRKR